MSRDKENEELVREADTFVRGLPIHNLEPTASDLAEQAAAAEAANSWIINKPEQPSLVLNQLYLPDTSDKLDLNTIAKDPLSSKKVLEILSFIDEDEMIREICKALEFVTTTPLFEQLRQHIQTNHAAAGKRSSKNTIRAGILFNAHAYTQRMLERIAKSILSLQSSREIVTATQTVIHVEPQGHPILYPPHKKYQALTKGEGGAPLVHQTMVSTLVARSAVLPLLGFSLSSDKQIAIPSLSLRKEKTAKETRTHTTYQSNKHAGLYLTVDKRYQGKEEQETRLTAVNEKLIFTGIFEG